jgi:phage replication-related protein YjqB (UPF0714/DUF867 family)
VSFAELLASPGVQEVVELRSDFGFMAFHGGSLERMTDVIAIDAAERAGASVYAVVQPPELRWHIPSHRVSGSPALDAYMQHVSVAVALHGYGRQGFWDRILLGGSNRALAAHVADCLARSVTNMQPVCDLADIPADLAGLHPDNPVNRPRLGGVQVELPPRVRGLTTHEYPIEPLVEALADAAQTWRPIEAGP